MSAAGRAGKPVIAIDGPAASGKGTLARRIAAHYGFAHLDTGSLYRAVAHELLQRGEDPADAALATRAAQGLDTGRLPGMALRGDAVGTAAGIVAAVPGVRAALLDVQRRFATDPPDGAAGAVLDGRDVGTVICPEATVKLFITASVAIRARRRYEELRARGEAADERRVRADLEERDRRDETRAVAPLRPAPDAHLLDTSYLDIEAAFAAARAIIDRVLISG